MPVARNHFACNTYRNKISKTRTIILSLKEAHLTFKTFPEIKLPSTLAFLAPGELARHYNSSSDMLVQVRMKATGSLR